MEVVSTVVIVLAVVMGLMLTPFTILNLVGDIRGLPLETFRAKFTYEMDEVMGGQLGIPHYSKVEAMLLAVGCIGAWVAVFTDGLLLPCMGFICISVYMIICVLYAVFVGISAVPFLVFSWCASFCFYGKFSELLALHDSKGQPARFASSGEVDMDLKIVVVFAGIMLVVLLISAGVMKIRNTEERKEFNERFVSITKWCDKNPGFVWLPGKGAPEGFKEDEPPFVQGLVTEFTSAAPPSPLVCTGTGRSCTACVVQ